MAAIDKLRTLFEVVKLAAEAHQTNVATKLAKTDREKDDKIRELEARLARLESSKP